VVDLQALVKREVSPDRMVSELVEGARSDVASVLGAVVARSRGSVLADEVKGEIAEVDQLVKASVEEREALRVELAGLADQVVLGRAELEVARLQWQRAKAGQGGDVPDLAEVEAGVRALERQLDETRSRLTTVSNRLVMAERQKATLAEVLSRLESLPVGDPDVLAVLRSTLAGHD